MKLDVDLIYPVGSIYMSVNSTSPATLFGGTWEQIKDTFLLGSGSYTLGATGGEATHTLTVEEMPTHNHEVPMSFKSASTSTGTRFLANTTQGWWTDDYTESNYMGKSQPHNNMPPYLVVNIWKRTA